MTSPLPALPTESSAWDQALYAFLVEKGNRSGSKRTVESYSQMLWHFFTDTTPDRVTPAVVLSYAQRVCASAMIARTCDWSRLRSLGSTPSTARVLVMSLSSP